MTDTFCISPIETDCPICGGDSRVYGVAPHECFWRKGPEFTLGQSTLLPVSEWEGLFVPELEDGETWADFVYPTACGTYYCAHCQQAEYQAHWERFVAKFGPPPAQGIEAGTAETPSGSVHESPVAASDAPHPSTETQP